MQTYISFLRGINVSGQKSIKMIDLQTLYEGVGLMNVKTYIQSGNVIFQSEIVSNKAIEEDIEKQINQKYKFSVPVIIRSLSEMTEIIESKPFANVENIDMKKIYISFLSEKPDSESVESITKLSYLPEILYNLNKEIYLYCPSGYGNTKLSNNFLENKLKVKATTRNWNTTNKLIEIASSL